MQAIASRHSSMATSLTEVAQNSFNKVERPKSIEKTRSLLNMSKCSNNSLKSNQITPKQHARSKSPIHNF